MNDWLEDLLNGQIGRWWLLDRTMQLTASDLLFVIGLSLVVLWFWPVATRERATNQRVVFLAGLAALAALAVGGLVGALHPEARPFVSDRSARLLIPHAADNGLPSDHALVSFAVAGAVLRWRRGVGVLLVISAVAIGVARVYAGVHWPSEVAIGAAIGLGIGTLAARTAPWWTGPQRWVARWLPRQLVASP